LRKDHKAAQRIVRDIRSLREIDRYDVPRRTHRPQPPKPLRRRWLRARMFFAVGIELKILDDRAVHLISDPVRRRFLTPSLISFKD